MHSEVLRPLARRLLKSALRRAAYEDRSKTDPRFERILDVEHEIFADAEKEWSQKLSQLNVEDNEVQQVLRSELAVAKASVERMLDELEIRDVAELHRCMALIDVDSFLPSATKLA